jgi:rod shape determining protein RodA
MKDFSRTLSDAETHFSRKPSIWVRLHIDIPLLILLMMLSIGGLFVLYSGSGGSIEDVQRQSIRFALGVLVMFVVAQIDASVLKRWSPRFYLVGIALLVAVLLVGVGAKGAQRWLSLGSIRFQPSEIMKLVVPMMIAWYLANRKLPPRFKYVIVSLMLILVPVGLIAKQPDLGTSLLIGASGIFILLLSGLRWRIVFGFIGLVLALLYPFWQFVMHDYQKTRVLTLFNPESDPLGAGWNIIQSKIAIGSGGLWGKGWLNGTQSHLEFLPESHTDFIIAVFAEEFGFFGVLALLGLYLLIVFRGLYIAVKAQDSYSRLLAGSITLTFFVYVFVNIGMVSGILPVVGVPLPLVSYGGTSIITLLAGFGILMSIHTHRKLLTK